MKSRFTGMAALLFVITIFGFMGSARADALTDKAKQLLANNESQKAYELLEPRETERAGDPAFDYLFGIAAIDSGHIGRAIFALERAEAVQPNNALIQAELGRAYRLHRELDSAKGSFRKAEKGDIPPAARQAIREQLSAIEQQQIQSQPSLTGYIELGGGYDSNVNSGPADNQVAIPLFGGLIATLNPAATGLDDGFGNGGAGLNLRYPLPGKMAFVAGVNASQSLLSRHHQFELTSYQGNAGLDIVRGRHDFLILLQGARLDVDYKRYRDSGGGTLQWLYNIDDRNQASLYAQWSQLNYPTQHLRDADRLVGGGSIGHAFASPYNPTLFVGGYVGQEQEQAAGVPHLGHNLFGARMGGQFSPANRLNISVSATIEDRHYGGADPFFLIERRETQSTFQLGARYRLKKQVALIAQAMHIINNSNISIYQYTRSRASLSVRLAF